ncbi:hypothetical protein CDD83_4277 [Cordyceps sp. RAO-2017]|nr:hypothetical protein CDD83_4277 [Cordyceps sp. RAO-2017]
MAIGQVLTLLAQHANALEAAIGIPLPLRLVSCDPELGAMEVVILFVFVLEAAALHFFFSDEEEPPWSCLRRTCCWVLLNFAIIWAIMVIFHASVLKTEIYDPSSDLDLEDQLGKQYELDYIEL